jgi:hypothetical protein
MAFVCTCADAAAVLPEAQAFDAVGQWFAPLARGQKLADSKQEAHQAQEQACQVQVHARVAFPDVPLGDETLDPQVVPLLMVYEDKGHGWPQAAPLAGGTSAAKQPQQGGSGAGEEGGEPAAKKKKLSKTERTRLAMLEAAGLPPDAEVDADELRKLSKKAKKERKKEIKASKSKQLEHLQVCKCV